MIKVEVEGTDGAGKTTALKYLLGKLQQAEKKVLETREVGSPHIQSCVKLRELVLNPESNLMGESMEFIFAAMRLENDRFYKSVADQYDIILSDRGWLSHLAYTDHNVSKQFTDGFYLGMVEKMADLPDAIVYLRVDGETALNRRIRRGEEPDVIELKGPEYQEKVRESFEGFLSDYRGTGIEIIEIDATQDLDGVKKQLDGAVEKLLQLGQEV